MNKVIERLGEVGIIPVIAIKDAQDAVPLAKALDAGDLPIAEITFRTEAAEESIKRIAAEVPAVLVGAGTVLTVDQTKRAVAVGAKFIVAPGFNEKVVDYCLQNNIPVTPGVNTASEIEKALEKGLEVLKFFPAEASGGLKTIKALAGPYTTVKFYPTGGINPSNVADYLTYDRVFTCGGSWMVKSDLIATKRFDEITRLCKEAINLVLGFEFVHLGINVANEDEAMTNANIFADLFAFPVRVGTSSIFASSAIEINKSIGLGAHGHIAIRTNSLKRALAYLKRKGINISGEMKLKNSKPVAAYIDKEVAGFAIHLLQK
jgi:2-dehydro-3-deoxyphosphogluconate aldolase/(4S)-4-hydroxy-2-oxoglutarate aldolase